MADYLTNETDLKVVADAIRAKGATSAPLVFPNGFASAISAIKTTPVLQSKTVTPSKDSQTIIADSPYDGLSQVVVNGDSNLISNNIKKGTTIFGVSGIYTGTTGETTIYCQAASYDSNYGVLLEFSYVPADPEQRIINLNFGSGIRARYNIANFGRMGFTMRVLLILHFCRLPLDSLLLWMATRRWCCRIKALTIQAVYLH